ncbi:phage tail tape measure protein [Cytobacillus firmus]|uniref:phage tail tape measure protein n=1 Tax=Cytobacillus firmus TaxID=1399 RepID=UPI0036B1E408
MANGSGEVGALRITLGLNSAGMTQELKNVNARLNALNSEFRAISTSSARFDNSLDNLRSRSDVLSRTMTVHRTKVEELRRKYEESKATKGEDAQETIRLATAYNRAISAMNRTEDQLRSTNAQIQEQSSTFNQLRNEVNTSVDNITRQMRVMESSFDAVTAGSENFGDSLEDLQQREEHLTQSLSLHQRRVEELTRLHEEAARSKGEDSAETQDLQIRLNRATQAMNETERQLESTTAEIEDQTNSWRNLSRNMETVGASLTDNGARMRDIGQTLSASVTLPIVGLGVAAGKVANDLDSSVGRIEARLGVTSDRAEELGEVAEDVWRNAFGESVREAGDAITLVSNNLEDISDCELKSATEAAYFLSEAFDADLNESTRAAGQLMKDFGDSSGQAFDLITWGFQNGLDYTGEFLDTIREYSPQFAELGYTSEQMGNAMKLAFDAGAWSLDKVGDSIKESHLRMGALDKATVEAYQSMGLNAEEYVGKIAKGGETGNKAFQTIVKKIMEVDDATERNALSTALFGTQYEDLREKVIFAMAGASKEIKGLEGTTQRATDAIQRNFGTRLQKVWRDFQSDLKPIGDELIEIAEDVLPKISDVVGKVTGAFANMSPEAKNTALAVAAVTAAAGPVIMGVGMLTTGVGALTTGLAPLIAGIGASGGLAATLTALTGPVGLTIAGLGLAAGAVIAVKNATEKANEVNLEHAESLVEQQKSLEELTGKYEALREKNKLSNDELLLFRDIQDDLKTAGSAEEVGKLTKQADNLREKSGLSNAELEEMLGLNDKLIERVPEAGRAFSDQGNAILENTDDLHLANEALRDSIQLELELQKTKAEAKLDENLRGQIEAREELNEKIRELNNAQIETAAKEYQLGELKKEQQEAYAAGETQIADMMENDLRLLEFQVDQQKKNVGEVAAEVEEKRKSVEKSNEQIAKTQEIYNELINLQLASAGINATGAEGIAQLDSAISKTQSRITELNNLEKAQGGLNEAQQKELDNLLAALGMYRDTKGEIQNIQGEQEDVNGKIDAGKIKAGEMSDVLSKSEVKNIKFTGNGYSDAKIISDEADKDVSKEIDVTDYGKANSIHKKAGESVTKKVTLSAVWTGVKSGIKSLLPNLFAKGTRNAPEGLAMVGEEGPELVHLPQGAKVIPNPDTEAILRNWNIPMMATGGVTLSSGMAYVGERGREIVDLSSAGAATAPLPSKSQPLQTPKQPLIIQMVAPDNREMARWLVDDISDLQDFKNNRIKLFGGAN